MQFLIADTFTAALARLTTDEQKAVKITVFDLQANAATPGHSLHKLDRARDKQFWSARVNGDLRIIVHWSDRSLLLCYVDHHDKAYAWAERRKLETHPHTGAAQIIEVRESVIEIPVHRMIESPAPSQTSYPPSLSSRFASIADAQLLEYGVPADWIADVRSATEDSIFTIAAALPSEAAEALIELAAGGVPKPRPVEKADPFGHPDAQRRFRVMHNVDELERALNAPWDKWAVFLHPAQRELVDREFNGPARAAGSAGTGKTVVALHRAVALARKHQTSRVLLTTFSIPLARMLKQKLRALVGNDPELSSRIEVNALDEVVLDLHEQAFGRVQMATGGMIEAALADLTAEHGRGRFSDAFVYREWHEVVDAWQIDSWESYRDVQRLGRKQRLNEGQRAELWRVFAALRQRLDRSAMMTMAQVYAVVTHALGKEITAPFHHAVVDEAQDVSVAQLRFLAALGTARPDALFFAGDQGQRIYQLPFSWKALGVDIRGRSQVLRVNYRTSHQIRGLADTLLGEELRDVDGIVEERRNTVSVFNGPEPRVEIAADIEAERTLIATWLRDQVDSGVQPGEIGVFVRSRFEVARAAAAVELAGLSVTTPQPGAEAEAGKVVLMPMQLAKGLEFRAVVVAACDDDVLPLQSRLETAGEESDIDDILATERYLLYVACTRARDALLITGVAPASEFLTDLQNRSDTR